MAYSLSGAGMESAPNMSQVNVRVNTKIVFRPMCHAETLQKILEWLTLSFSLHASITYEFLHFYTTEISAVKITSFPPFHNQLTQNTAIFHWSA
jgi:hypothetical protein